MRGARSGSTRRPRPRAVWAALITSAIVCFLIALYVLKRYAFGPIQHTIDQRRERIRQSLDEADHAREEAQKLLEEHRKLIASAQTDAEQILGEARRIADANERRMREELEADRQRRLEETRKQIEAETRREAVDPIGGAEGQHAGARPADRREFLVRGRLVHERRPTGPPSTTNQKPSALMASPPLRLESAW